MGFEHIVREVGQIYEAFFEDTDEKDKKNQVVAELPGKFAELLHYGLAMELMDGENSFIPVNWIGAVFDKLGEHCKEGANHVHLQSIVGLQSSGKSSFLNC